MISGRAVAGMAGMNRGNYRCVSSMTAGISREIAALNGAARTADVVAETDITLLQCRRRPCVI